MDNLRAALAPGGGLHALTNYPQFILWKAVPRADGKTDKLPVSPTTGEVKGVNDPAIYADAETALAAAKLFGLGVGFVFTLNDPFYFLDIDGQREGDPIAQQLIRALPGAAVEVSQSGQGLHVFGQTEYLDHGCRNIPLHIELYTVSRFAALTGTMLGGDAYTNSTAQLAGVAAQYFPPDTAVGSDEGWTEGPSPEWNGPEDDDALIAKALSASSSRASFLGKATFSDLWYNNADALAVSYPDTFGGGRAYDGSSADAGLSQRLSFWTGKDCARIERLLFKSGLRRPKWEERPDYIQRTILNAVNRTTAVYNSGHYTQQAAPASGAPAPAPSLPAPVSASVPGQAPVLISGTSRIMTADQQIEYFAGWVWVLSVNKLLAPNGTLVNPEQFKTWMGGYEFVNNAHGKTTDNAWKLWQSSPLVMFPKVWGMTYRPDKDPGCIIEEEGIKLLNIWVDVPTPREPGDPTPFLNLLALMLPDEGDRQKLLAYMAALVQYKGVKFRWAPLIQGTEGNGKSTLTNIMATILGWRNTHKVKASDITNNFNAFLGSKLFMVVDDVFTPGHKQDTLESFKPLLTEQHLQIQPKGVDQFTARICANFMLTTNHKGALLKSANDRRIAPFHTKHQCLRDLQQDGLTGDYFPNFYKWLDWKGYGILHEYLATYSIPDELNPATLAHRAPYTSSTMEAISYSEGGAEGEIKAAVEEGQIGFRKGWISSWALTNLLEEKGYAAKIPRNKRRELLQSLGYDRHPGLFNGRTNNAVQPDGISSILFIQHGHISIGLTSANDIATAYARDQGVGV